MMPCVQGLSPNSKNSSQAEIWKLEQRVVASLIQVETDPAIDTTVVGENSLFHLVRDDHHDIYSFSSTPELYGGVDVSFPNGDEQGEEAVAVYVVIDKRTMEVVYFDHEFFIVDVPYISTFLAFREIQPLELLVNRQMQQAPEWTPSSILVDGNGIFHPRHAGIACFLGIRTGIPTIGVGKTLLYEAGWTRETVSYEIDQFLFQLHSTIQQNPLPLAHQLSRYRGLVVKRPVSKPNRNNSSPLHSQNPKIATATTTTVDVNDSGRAHEDSNGLSASNHPMCIDDVDDDDDEDEEDDDHNNGIDRVGILQDLAPFCNGIAVQLGSEQGGSVTSESNNQNGQHNDSHSHDKNGTTTTSQKQQQSRFPILGCALIGHGGQIASSAKSEPVSGTRNPIFVSVGHKTSLQRAVQICASLSMARIPEPIRQADLMGRDLLRQRKIQRQQLPQQS